MKKPEHAVIFLLVCAIVFVILYTAWREDRLKKSYSSIIAEQNDTIHYHLNDKGRIVAQKLAAEATVKQLRDAYPNVVKELKEEFDVKMKDLKAYVSNQIVAQGQGNASVTNNYYLDSAGNEVRRRDFLFTDGYLTFSSIIYDSLNTAQSTYTYSDTITTVIHREKKWLFGNEKLYSSTSLRNPNAKAVGTTNLLVNSRDKRFVIYGGIGYDPLNNQPSISVGIGYAIFKF